MQQTVPGDGSAPFSVIIPAYNEANVIAACLRAIYDSAPSSSAPEVIVVCNGCSDDTAAAARRAAPAATVVEIREGSKPLALNTGNEMARALPRLFVDADIIASYETLAAVADALRQPGIMAASPAADVDTSGCDIFVRAYYRAWRRHPYRASGAGGSGIYGLSADGLARLGRFPAIIADDGFVRALFSLEEQRRVFTSATGERVSARIKAPRRVSELIRCESRWRSGDAQLRSFGPPKTDEGGPSAGIKALWRAGVSPVDLAIYSAIKMAGRALLQLNRYRGRASIWHRDESSRGTA
jgi:glycosyltransferase involved in cell wall biosynthesis